MDERKLQFTGGSSFIVSLPKDWVAEHGLKAGSPIFIDEQKDGSLMINSKKTERGPREVAITAGALQGTLRKIIAAYISGADTIVLKGKDTATICEDARLRLAGLEIVEEHREYSVMRVLAHEEDLNFGVLLRRLYSVSEVMCNLALRRLQTCDDVRLEAQRRDNDADRLYILIMRCLYNTQGAYSPMKVMAAKTLEHIADHAEDICGIEGDVLPNAELSALWRNAMVLYEESFKCLLASRLDEGLFDRHDEMRRLALKKKALILNSKKERMQALELQSLWASCSDMMGHALNVCEIAANMHYIGEKALKA